MSNGNVPSPAVRDPRSQLSGPSVGLLITGIIGGIFELTSFIAGYFGTSFVARMEDELPEQLESIFEGSFWTASSLVGVLIAVFLVYAALKMRELNQWGLCVAASVLAMIPCISPCCIIGLPIGIWCLVTLNRPDIKAAFH